ncbi:MAG: formamidopyrimidine-DNA glycosylase [Lysobacterales bacterium]|jgi:formamidopyrimidine-DNA glycosylase|nr:MAG: formamidopyrimidine-DNA glycosylase [Xanthomonadales bacterium]
MPELPEVETTRAGIEPFLRGRRIERLLVRERRLRVPVPEELPEVLAGQRVQAVGRRGKYLLIEVERGAAIVHLGMSGTLRLYPEAAPAGAHDHLDLMLEGGIVLRFTDPRRFGCWLWQPQGTLHPALAALGPEPFDPVFDGAYLWRRSRGRIAPIKSLIMDPHIVVGVGNIYAQEALFCAGIRPQRSAGQISLARLERLVAAIRERLSYAIRRGGTTLRDFLAPDGKPGYFEQELFVYGRGGEPCRICGTTLKAMRIAGRMTAWCPRCQR